MNRVASRTLIVLVMVLALLTGTVFFVVEYALKSQQWVMTSGSPHVYNGSSISLGVVTDSEGKLIVSMKDGRTYSTDSLIRRSTLHWTGDREGNIPSTILNHYSTQMAGYDALNGTYSYGDTAGSMELTLNASVQAAALEAMGSRVGTVAVYNYETGELICAISTPTFDPDAVPDIAGDTTGAYEGVYVNRFLKSKYIPGSIFKIVTLAAALETIPDIQEQTFTCTGSLDVEGGDITCERAHGEQTLKEAFCNSCNCAFAQITLQVGRDKMESYVEQFGLTDVITFDGLTTAKGNYAVSGTADEEFAWSGIGQYTDQVNPCSYLRFVGAVANDGVAVEPYVVSQITVGSSHTYEAKAGQGKRLMSASTAQVLKQYMENNVVSKYGADNFPGLTVAAKSGTGEVGGEKKPNAMFTGFVTDPDLPLAFIVCIEDGGYGAQTCVPVLQRVLEACKDALD